MTETKTSMNGLYMTTILRIRIRIIKKSGFASTRKDPNGVGEILSKLIGTSSETFDQAPILITYTKDPM